MKSNTGKRKYAGSTKQDQISLYIIKNKGGNAKMQEMWEQKLLRVEWKEKCKWGNNRRGTEEKKK